jgi:hypothetical protein
MQDEQLIDISQIKYRLPEIPWETRKVKIKEDLEAIIGIFQTHTDDQEFINKLKELEAKFK